MQLPDTAGGQSRWEAQIATLRRLAPLLGELERSGRRGARLRLATARSGLAERRLSCRRPRTGRRPISEPACIRPSQQTAGRRLVGVILMGDGTQTAYQPEVEIFDAARELGNRGYPLYTVTFGPAGDAAQSRDVAMENLPEQYTVFVKNELAVRGLVRVRGLCEEGNPRAAEIEDEQGGRQEYSVRCASGWTRTTSKST